MKKLTAWILAFAMLFMLGAAAAEEGVTGDWYGLMYGAAVTMTFNEDGTYTMIAGQAPISGTYELKDGIVYMDGSNEQSEGFVYDGSSLVNERFGVTFTREENVQGVALADVNPDAPPEAFAGEWTCRYINSTGAIVDLQQVPEELLRQMETVPAMKIEGTNVTMTGMDELFDSEPIPMVYENGTLKAEKDEASVQIQMLQDGMAALSVTISDQEICVWFAPAAAAE